jgi:hypothetical protein
VRKALLSCLFVLLWSAANAQVGQVVSAVMQPSTSGYTGPGDIVAYTGWYGLRAYSSATANGITNIIKLENATSTGVSNFVALTNGALDIASITTFDTVDATCTATGSTTTLTVTSCTGTPAVNDQIFAVGVTNPTTITAIGSCAGGSGTCTMSQSNTFGSPVTVTFRAALTVPEWYDQTGNARHLLQGTVADQPQFLLNCFNTTLPCIQGTVNAQSMASSANFTPSASVISLSFVGGRIAGTVGPLGWISEANNSLSPLGASSTQSQLRGGANSLSFTESNAWHATNGVINGASTTVQVDGTATPGTTTTSTTANKITGANGVTGDTNQYGECGFLDAAAFSSGNLTSLHTNASAYWGTP